MRRREPLTNILLAVATLTLVVAISACPAAQPAKPAPPKAVPPPPPTLDAIPRAAFNRLAAEHALPLFWTADDNGNKTLDPGELAVLWGMDDSRRADWVAGASFTAELREAYQRLAQVHAGGYAAAGLAAAEAERRRLVREELAQGKPTLVLTALSELPDHERKMAARVLEAAKIVERIYARQQGVHELERQLLADDPASRAMFHRNQGPWCEAPLTESNPQCNAIPSLPKKLSGLYPAALQRDPKFCEQLAARADGEALLHHFFTVSGAGDALKAVPYHEAYADDSRAVSDLLVAAARDLAASPDEQALQAYLGVAAQAFLDGNWLPADEAWAKMNARNSKWYLRIGPDEVYSEPCSRKAHFHVSFARINRESLKLEEQLEPHKLEMERVLAGLAGKPYRARKVTFHLPDFIDIVFNAGDSRYALGATIGQSLPNWGPVANEGRGRTVVMTNLYTDPDSKAQLREQASSLLCKGSLAAYSDDQEGPLLSVVLHEAAHNLGPAHEYKVRGQKASQLFGGPLSSTMEELKAQTAALYFTSWLADKKVIEPELARRAHTRDIVWAFGHISRGMYTANKRPNPYSQLAAIQLAFLLEQQAITWSADELAANGKDQGCFELHHDRFGAAIERLMRRVAQIKGRGDRKGAELLIRDYVDVRDAKQRVHDVIRERWLRYPKASFVYAITQ